ncbi:MAG: hypothetical protein AAF586_06780, partial [Planctomycetota bacterium]
MARRRVMTGRALAAAMLAVCAAGCETTPTTGGASDSSGSAAQPSKAQLEAAAGYELLYAVVSKQRNVAQLFGLKKPTPAVKTIVTQIGEASGDL